jgi:hypothetical protein
MQFLLHWALIFQCNFDFDLCLRFPVGEKSDGVPNVVSAAGLNDHDTPRRLVIKKFLSTKISIGAFSFAPRLEEASTEAINHRCSLCGCHCTLGRFFSTGTFGFCRNVARAEQEQR